MLMLGSREVFSLIFLSEDTFGMSIINFLGIGRIAILSFLSLFNFLISGIVILNNENLIKQLNGNS